MVNTISPTYVIAEWNETVSPISGLVISNYKAYPADDIADTLSIVKVTCNWEVSRVTFAEPIEMGVEYILEANGIHDMVGNMSATSGSFGYLADLTFTDLSVEPDHLVDGSTPIDISYTLENQGNFTADSFKVTLWLKTVEGLDEVEYLLDTVEYAALADSHSLTDSLTVFPPQDTREMNYIIARVDDNMRVSEWNEGNNEEEFYLYSFMPRVISILDVPDDGGGWVEIEFYRSSADASLESESVNSYQIFRKDLDVAGSAWKTSSDPSLAPGIYFLNDWTQVASIDADFQDEYSLAVPTHSDSSLSGTGWSLYFVRAVRLVSSETVFYYSCPDSGYSIDNLIGPADNLDCFHASIAEGNVNLVWQLLEADGREEFIVKRSFEGGAFIGIEVDIFTPRDGFYSFIDSDVEPGKDYSYRVEIITGGGSYILFETEILRTPAVRLTLYQNRPNPFNPSTEILYYLPGAGRVSLEVFDVAGRCVRTLVNGTQPPGQYRVEWIGRDNNGSRVASGVYFYRLRAGKEMLTRKMVLLR